MEIKILAFGIAKDILGGANLSVELPGQPTVGQLKAHLCRSYPDFEKLASFAIALNTEYAEDEQAILAGDEVVVIPPVSGG
ncbi:MAG: MoaD/ThiS family protein [Lewinellaceae bacterium]|nr:MoaD/ThiS family protein [Lewinellaceae bacterium]